MNQLPNLNSNSNLNSNPNFSSNPPTLPSNLNLQAVVQNAVQDVLLNSQQQQQHQSAYQHPSYPYQTRKPNPNITPLIFHQEAIEIEIKMEQRE